MRAKSHAFLFLCLILCNHLQGFAQDATTPETHEFQAEIGRLMDIIINSLYTNKEVFLREIISNASDALDKIRFLAVSDPSILKDFPELAIRIEFNAEDKTISIYDSGIGMTKQDLINNLGTVAKSGTTNFVQALAQGQNLNLIGQFGVGFYASFLVANKVTVITKHTNDEQYIWESSAAHSFTIAKDPEGNTLKRGTKIILHLKQDSYEFCEDKKLTELIHRYSDFINFPIYLKVQKEISKEVEDETIDEVVDTDKAEKKDDLEIKDEDDTPKPKTKTVTEKVWDWELINTNKAIWLRDKDEITQEEYNNFYKAIAKEYDDPLTHIHFKAEGVEFRSILYVPGHAPSNLYESYYNKLSTLKLYVRRVLVNEKFEELLPKYLNFVRGVIDSDELPINVSREGLQEAKMLKVMGNKLVKKVLEMLKKLGDTKIDAEESDEEDEEEEEVEDTQTKETQQDDEKQKEREAKKKEKIEKYNRFWREFGKNIKLGIIEDAANRNRLAQLTRWHTSYAPNELSSFDEYIARMKPNQEYIYYIGGENKEVLLKTPAIQGLLKKGYEVLLLDDPIDEFCLQNVYDYEKKSLINVGKGSFVMPTDDETEKKKIKKLKKIYKPLTEWWKNLLKDKLDVVTISERLVDDPCIVVGSVYGYSATMERISKAQAYGPSNPMASSKRNLEINAGHPVIKELLSRVEGTPDKETEEMATLLYEAALLNSGFSLSDPSEFAHKFFKIFNPAMGIAKDAKVEDVHVDLDEDDDEPEEPSVTSVPGSNGQPGFTETRTDNQIKLEFDDPRIKNKKVVDEDL